MTAGDPLRARATDLLQPLRLLHPGCGCRLEGRQLCLARRQLAPLGAHLRGLVARPRLPLVQKPQALPSTLQACDGCPVPDATHPGASSNLAGVRQLCGGQQLREPGAGNWLIPAHLLDGVLPSLQPLLPSPETAFQGLNLASPCLQPGHTKPPQWAARCIRLHTLGTGRQCPYLQGKNRKHSKACVLPSTADWHSLQSGTRTGK